MPTLGAESQFSITTCCREHTGTKCSAGNNPSLLTSTATEWKVRPCVTGSHHLVSWANNCYQQMVEIVTESFSLPDSVHVWALLVHVQGHGGVDVEVENGISPVSEWWHGHEDKRSQRCYMLYFISFIHSLICPVVSSPLHGVLVGSRHHRTTFLVVRSHRGCRVHGFSCLQLPPVAVVWSEWISKQTQYV